MCDVCVNVDVDTDFYYVGNDTSHFESLLYDTLLENCDAMTTIQGVIATWDPCMTLEITRNTPPDAGSEGSGGDDGDGDKGAGGDSAGDGTDETGGNSTDGGAVGIAEDPEEDDDGVSAFAFIGVAIAGLLLILLALFAVRRQREYGDDAQLMKHQELDDDLDETLSDGKAGETVSEESSGSPGRYKSRLTHVVGEEDSVFSGWTGYTEKEPAQYDWQAAETQRAQALGGMGAMDSSYQNDVHKCSSATCDLCEKNRQAGLQFISTGLPSNAKTHISLPVLQTESKRTYVARDTVTL